MKLLKTIALTFVLLLNLAIARPAWADAPKLTNTPEYTEVTQAIDALLQAKNDPEQSKLSDVEIEQQLADLKLQKYILETATSWAQCSNQTGKTIAVYGHKGKKADQPSTLYYLGDGQITDDDWNCDGVYLPTGGLVAGLPSVGDQELTEPLAVKVVSGTQLVATADPETGAVGFNVNPAQVFKAGEGTWGIPNLTQADLDAQTPNAPVED